MKRNDKVWGIYENNVITGKALRVYAADERCSGRIDIQTADGMVSLPEQRVFDHEPQLVTVSDDYGEFSQWQ